MIIENNDVDMAALINALRMSRFGREYLKVGYYTENYFPDHNVRFIAINDNVDCVDGATDMDDFIPIKNIMNELYAKDISRKVRSAHNTRGRAGEPLSQPPYGYVKDPQDKKRWIIDPEAAAVVREIFKLYLDGNGEDTIARIMQDEQHLNCTAYWASKGINRGGKKKKRDQRRLTALWNPGTGYRCSGRFDCGGLILCKQISVRPFSGLCQLNRCE